MPEPSQDFKPQQLGWMRRRHSQSHLRTKSSVFPADADSWRELLQNIADEIAADDFSFSGLYWHRVRGKLALSTKCLEDALVIRKINDNIRRAYGLRQPSRTTLIKTAIQAAKESTPKSIVRIDLKGCFESIDRSSVINSIKADALLSTQTSVLIELLFEKASSLAPGQMPQGIPRGLSISTSLAELKLRGLDQRLRRIEGVYLYLRFVDDILIFSTLGSEETLRIATSTIKSAGLRINTRKSRAYRASCACELNCTHGTNCPCIKSCVCSDLQSAHLEIEYLGYKLLIPSANNKKVDASNEVFCVLSERKARKIKSRIWRAISEFEANKDTPLLVDRIMYLVANQRVAASPGSRGLFNGLSYTHPEYLPPPGLSSLGTLKDIDQFYQIKLRHLAKTNALSAAEVQALKKLTFESGFSSRRRLKLSAQRVLQVTSCWDD